MSMLTTAQPKLNFIGLDSLPKLIVNLHHCFRDVTHQLVPTLLKLVASKQHSELALNSINCLVKFVGKFRHVYAVLQLEISFLSGKNVYRLYSDELVFKPLLRLTILLT